MTFLLSLILLQTVSVERVPDVAPLTFEVSASMIVDTSPQALWAEMLDCPNAPSWVPKMTSCTILSSASSDESDLRRHEFHGTFLIPSSYIVFRSTYEAPHLIRFTLLDGDLEALEGEWRIEPTPDGSSLLRYKATLSAAAPVPGFVARRYIKGETKRLFHAIANHVAPSRELAK